MILDDPEKTYNGLQSGEQEVITELGAYLWHLANRVRTFGFLSTNVPNVPNGDWVAFIFYKGHFGFLVRYKSGDVYYKYLDTPGDVFTPNVLNLDTISPLSKEDAMERARKLGILNE